MTHCSTSAIVLHRRSYGDYDLILTFLTRDHGKRVVIAKAARKSSKRFPGILELFGDLQILFRIPRSKGLAVLEEATLLHPFEGIRTDIVKTAYASYWAELIYLWAEEGQPLTAVYHLLAFVLAALSNNAMPPMSLSVLFQMRFIGQEGLQPILQRCACCQTAIDAIAQQDFCIDLDKGGIVCGRCPVHGASGSLRLSKGTLKQLQWVVEGQLTTACRMRFSRAALVEATRFLESYVPFHLGRNPKSLQFLQEVRRLHSTAKEDRPHAQPARDTG